MAGLVVAVYSHNSIMVAELVVPQKKKSILILDKCWDNHVRHAESTLWIFDSILRAGSTVDGHYLESKL